MVKVRGWVTDYAYMKILKKFKVGVCERDGERETGQEMGKATKINSNQYVSGT